VCQWEDLVPILNLFHYRKAMMGGSIKICLGVRCDGIFIGGGVLGNPWHPQTYSENGQWNCIELRRLCFYDDAPKNTESWTIGKIAWWLRKYTTYNRILSYSDLGVGHTGTIYKASGFRLVGETGGGRKVRYNGREFHMRSLTINRDYARDLALRVDTGEADIVETGGKLIWLKDIAPAHPVGTNMPLEPLTPQESLF